MSGPGRIEHTVDADHRHRWHAVAGNGELLGHGDEGFVHPHDRTANELLTLRALLTIDGAADVVDEWLAERHAAEESDALDDEQPSVATTRLDNNPPPHPPT
jgi:hypothetical protein